MRQLIDYIGIHSWKDAGEFVKNVAGIILWTVWVVLPPLAISILVTKL